MVASPYADGDSSWSRELEWPPPLAVNRTDAIADLIESFAAVLVLAERYATVHETRCNAKPQVSMGM